MCVSKIADVTLISTGSEVYLVNDAAKQLKEQGIKARVVSAPCLEIFDAQDQEYRLSVLPDGAPVMSVEAYSTSGWTKYAHESFGLVGYGASGPADQVYKHFELTVSNNGCFSPADALSLTSDRLDSLSSPRALPPEPRRSSTSTRRGVSPSSRPSTRPSRLSCLIRVSGCLRAEVLVTRTSL